MREYVRTDEAVLRAALLRSGMGALRSRRNDAGGIRGHDTYFRFQQFVLG